MQAHNPLIRPSPTAMGEAADYWRQRALFAEQRLQSLIELVASGRALQPPAPIVIDRAVYEEMQAAQRRRDAFDSLPDDYEVN